jgi:Fe-S-cluster containining protein
MKWEGSLCGWCGGQCCKVGFIVQVFPDEPLYNDDKYIHRAIEAPSGNEFRNMKSNGDGYTCVALGEDGKCTVWDKRPQMCRDFEVESDRCKAIRKEYGRP